MISQNLFHWQNIFAFATHFVDVQERDHCGCTLFLRACESVWYASSFPSRENFRILDLFLEKGASVQERTPDGSTCLHLCCWAIKVTPPEHGSHDTLKSLIDQGADVYAKDNRGRSVSHVAYSRGCGDLQASSYCGDLWDAVLDACGYDIRQFRQGYPRTGRYSPRYTRSHFRALWKGREERCPYWDDSCWVSPIDEDGGGDRSEDLCLCYGSTCWRGVWGYDSIDEDSDLEMDSGQSDGGDDEDGEKGEDDSEEDDSSEMDSDEQEDGDGGDGEDDQDDQHDEEHHTPWGPFLHSRASITTRDASSMPSLTPESQPPAQSWAHEVGEGPIWGSEEVREAVSWSSTVQYGSMDNNPWLGD